MDMLARLHVRGYQRLRLSSGWSPAGLHWRYSIAPVDQFMRNGYLLKQRYYPGEAASSTGPNNPPFSWDVGTNPKPDALASMFIARFPRVAAAGRGSDVAYAAWFAEMLEVCRPDGMPFMYGEHVDAAADKYFKTYNGMRVPLPPVARSAMGDA